MNHLYGLQLPRLVVCLIMAVTIGITRGCSRSGSGPIAGAKSMVQDRKQDIMPKAQDVLQRMRDHYAGLDTAVLTAKATSRFIGNGQLRQEQNLGTEGIYYQAPNLYWSDTEKPRKLTPFSNAQIEGYARALEDPERYRTVIPQLFQEFEIAKAFPLITYKGQESLNGEKTDVVVLERDLEIPPSLGMGGSSVLTLWVNERGQVRRYDLELKSTTGLPQFEFKNVSDGYRVDITEVDNSPLPRSFLSRKQPSQAAEKTDQVKEFHAQEVIVRMRNHYSSLKTAVLTVKINRELGASAKVQDKREFNSYHVYFQSPDLYGSDIEEPHRLPTVSTDQLEQYGRALIDPAFGYLIIIPQLFQGFEIAKTFPSIAYKGKEKLNGESADVVILERDMTGMPNTETNSTSKLILWVNGQGQLKRFDLGLKTGSARASSGPKGVDYTFRVEITETDNCPLPTSFLKKVQPKK